MCKIDTAPRRGAVAKGEQRGARHVVGKAKRRRHARQGWNKKVLRREGCDTLAPTSRRRLASISWTGGLNAEGVVVYTSCVGVVGQFVLRRVDDGGER